MGAYDKHTKEVDYKETTAQRWDSSVYGIIVNQFNRTRIMNALHRLLTAAARTCIVCLLYGGNVETWASSNWLVRRTECKVTIQTGLKQPNRTSVQIPTSENHNVATFSLDTHHSHAKHSHATRNINAFELQSYTKGASKVDCDFWQLLYSCALHKPTNALWQPSSFHRVTNATRPRTDKLRSCFLPRYDCSTSFSQMQVSSDFIPQTIRLCKMDLSNIFCCCRKQKEWKLAWRVGWVT